MNPISAAIASIGLSSSRAFIPAFIAAVLLRFGADHEMTRSAGQQLLGASNVAGWFTSDLCLTVLGLLALLEVVAMRNQDVRALMTEIDHYAKPLMAVVLQLGLLSTTDAETLGKITAATQQASFLAPFLAAGVAFGTYIVASARNTVLRFVHDADPDNATGLHKVVAWGEDLFAVFGTALLLLFPIFISACIGIGILILLALQKRAQAREDASRVACQRCSAPMYRSSRACPTCSAANPSVMAVSFLGASTLTPADPATHAFDLAAKRRCPTCATRLPSRDPHAPCPACARAPFGDPQFTADYDAHLSARLPGTLIIVAALGLIPYLGLVLGVLFYRVHLVSPYRTWLGFGRNILTRWLLRLAVLVLILLHLIPLAGLIAAPLMALLNYLFFRTSFLSATDTPPSPARHPAPPTPPPLPA